MKLTFILLLATGKDIYSATSILIPSIITFFNLKHLFELIIIIKENDNNLLSLRLDELKKNINLDNLKISVHLETELINIKNIFNTYYLQMYLKLLAVKFIKTEHYLTLDSDNFFCKKSDIHNFIDVDTNRCYYSLLKYKDIWLKRSETFLNLKIKTGTNQTPFVFNKKCVLLLLKNINVNKAILNDLCSEYTLYQVYLKKNKLFDLAYFYRPFKNNSLTHIHKYYKPLQIKYKIKLYFEMNNNLVVSGIQSRCNLLDKSINYIKKYIPLCYYKKLNIAVLTLINGNIYYNRYKNAIKIKKEYCKYHNYDFIYEFIDDALMENKKNTEKNGWLKLYKLKNILINYDYVFVSDADVIITNRDIRIEDLILKYPLDNKCLLITTDYNSINSGNIIWKNCKESIELIDKIIELGNNKIRYTLQKPFKPKGIYEQASLIYLINRYKYFYNLIKIIPQFEMNSYSILFKELKKPNILLSISNIINRCSWREGDFLIHFAGFNYIENNKFKINCDKYIQKYINIYYDLISRKESCDYGKIL